MYIASSTADSPCNKEKKKDPPEHSYLKQLQLSMKPVYENGISRDTHKKKQFSKESHNTLYPKRPNFYEKKKKKLPFSLYFQKGFFSFLPSHSKKPARM